MAKSLDKVLQADGSYKWELVEISEAKDIAAAEAAKKTSAKASKTTKKAKASKVEE